jgi:hypothetical protein
MRPLKGKWITKHPPRTASVTFTAGDLVMITSGLVAPATTESTKHLGIIKESVASTDSDFATEAVKVAVDIPMETGCEFEADVTGTLLTTDVGLQFDLSDASTVNQDGTTYKVVTCKGFISATKGRFSLNSNIDYADIAWE